jgi:hypothetical protein
MLWGRDGRGEEWAARRLTLADIDASQHRPVCLWCKLGL